MLTSRMIPQFDSPILSQLDCKYSQSKLRSDSSQKARELHREAWRMEGSVKEGGRVGPRHFTASRVTSACFLRRHVSLFDGPGRTGIIQQQL